MVYLAKTNLLTYYQVKKLFYKHVEFKFLIYSSLISFTNIDIKNEFNFWWWVLPLVTNFTLSEIILS